MGISALETRINEPMDFEEVSKRILEWLPDQMKKKGVGASTPLRQQGLDSLDWITLLFNVEKHYGVKIKKTMEGRLQSVEDIARAVCQLADAKTSQTDSS
jgi:acyl carrier protein